MTRDTIPYKQGKQIYLREVRVSDVNESYYSWLNDPDVNQYLETRFVPRSIENITDFVKSFDGNPDSRFMAICAKEGDRHIGNIKLGPINWIHRYGDISLFIGDRASRGKGMATEAISLIVDYAFNDLNLNKVRAGCYASNLASAKAFEKVGFKREGLLRRQWFFKGEFIDEILLGLIRNERER